MKYELTEKEKSELLIKEEIYYYNSSGEYHREDGPAVIYADGNQYWWINGKRHREDGPAIIWADGTQAWYINGNRHREDGPAIIYSNGNQYWYINDKRHREDGPAVIYANGYQRWYINGKLVTDKVITWTKSCDIDIDNMSEPDKLLIHMFMNKFI